MGGGGGGGGAGMVGGVAMSGVIKKLSVGRHAAFNQVTRGACNRVYVNTAPETTCGAGRYEKLALALSAASYLHNRRFLEDHGGFGGGVVAYWPR